MKTLRLLALVAVASCSIGVGACSPSTCSAVGAESTVTIHLNRLPVSVVGSKARVCIAGTCRSSAVTKGPVYVMDALQSGDPVQVSLLLTGPSGRTLFDGRAAVTPVKFQPNGPGCSPTVWNANLDADGNGTLPVSTQGITDS